MKTFYVRYTEDFATTHNSMRIIAETLTEACLQAYMKLSSEAAVTRIREKKVYRVKYNTLIKSN